MKYFKITKTWAVKAESEAEAIKLIAGCDNLWNEKLREGMWKETDVSLFGYGGRKRLHSLLDSRRKNLQKGFWGSRSFGAKNNDLLQVFVFTGLLERLF